MKKLMVFAFFALSLGLTACGGNSNPLGSDDPFEDQPEEVQNGMLKPAPKPPSEKPIGKDIFVIDGEGFAEHVILQQNSEREVILTARSFFDKAKFTLEMTNAADFKGAKITATEGDAATKTPATIKFKWKPTAENVIDQVTTYEMKLLVYTTNLNHSYSYQKTLTVFVYREDFSAPEVLNIQKLSAPVKEGTEKTFIVTVRDRDALPTPYDARPELMFLPKYTYNNNSLVGFLSTGTPTQDPKDSSLWTFVVTLDLGDAELTDSSTNLGFMIAARSRFDKVSVPVTGEVRVQTSLSSLMTTAGDLIFKKGANNHVEFQIFDPKSEGVVTMTTMPNCAALLPGATCACAPKKPSDLSVLTCTIDWNVAPGTFLPFASSLNYSAQNANTDKTDAAATSTNFNLKVILAD